MTSDGEAKTVLGSYCVAIGRWKARLGRRHTDGMVLIISVIISAFQSTGSMDPKVLGAAIANTDGVEGATSNLSYSGGNGAPSKPVFVHHVVNGAPTLAATIQ